MNHYSVMLDGPNLQESVVYPGNWPLRYVGYWAKQYPEGQISVQLGLDMDSLRVLPMAYIVDHPEITLDELFDKQPTG